jgi:hypothetical protein
MGIWLFSAISPHQAPVKTTLDLSDDLLRRAKQAALDRGTTLRAIVEEGLERLLGPATVDAPLRLVTWPPAARRGAAPTLDAEAVVAAVKAERRALADDPARIARRLGALSAAAPRGKGARR